MSLTGPTLEPAARRALGRRRSQLRDELLEHLWRHFPEHCVILADPQTRVAVDLGIERAARYRFESTADVCLYASLMFFMGSYFDEDPQFPWAAAVLRETAEADRSQAMDRLYDATVEKLGEVIGKQGEYYRKALLWARAQPIEAIAQDNEGSIEHSIENWLRQAYSRKYDALSGEALNATIAMGIAAARDYGLTTRSGAIVYHQIMFLLGSFIDRDPLHPWVGQVLRDDSLTDPELKAERLHRQGVAQLERHLALDRLRRKV